jgi:hypothetical protein
MTLASVQAIVGSLNDAGVRFMVAGGLAVNAHGYLRFTKDADLVLELTPDNVRVAFTALASLGYRPIVPITAEQFGDLALREKLVREKGMQVLQFFSDEHPETPVDVFADAPFPFDEEYGRALVKELPGSGPVRFVTIPRLIRMKEAAGRPEDLIDIEHLRMLLADDERPA